MTDSEWFCLRVTRTTGRLTELAQDAARVDFPWAAWPMIKVSFRPLFSSMALMSPVRSSIGGAGRSTGFGKTDGDFMAINPYFMKAYIVKLQGYMRSMPLLDTLIGPCGYRREVVSYRLQQVDFLQIIVKKTGREGVAVLKPKADYISPEEYFRIEEEAEYKSEYFHGETFAMTGASIRHNRIAVNIVSDLDSSLEDSDCVVFSSDMKVRAEKDKHFVYPDASIVCGDVELEKGRNDMIVNPVAIFEVLSESTMDYDRGSKFKAYRQIPSLKEYILTDQDSCSVEHYFKDERNRWILEDLTNMEDILTVRSVGVELPLKRIYRRLDMEKPPGIQTQ